MKTFPFFPRLGALGRAVSVILLSAGTLWAQKPGKDVSADRISLRPEWQVGKAYRLQQRFEAKATVPGMGKPVFGWHQLLVVIPEKADDGVRLNISLEVIRVDFEMGDDRRRYYFRPGDEKRFQDAEGFPNTLLAGIERLVERRYQLALDGNENVTALAPIPTTPERSTSPMSFPHYDRKPTEDATPLPSDTPHDAASALLSFEGLPWQAITSALLHQGIPNEPQLPGGEWRHEHRVEIGDSGYVEIDLGCRFDGFKAIKERKLALIEFSGTIKLSLGPSEAEPLLTEKSELAPTNIRLQMDVTKLRGLTLVDTAQRAIVSTVMQLEGKVNSFGMAEFEDGESATFKKTLTLTLLAVEDLEK